MLKEKAAWKKNQSFGVGKKDKNREGGK